MAVLLVAPYPPRPDGIGAYAATQAALLRAGGEDVVVLSPPDGAGDVRVPFFGGRPFLRAVRAGRGVERIVVHFQPSLYFRPRRPVSKVLTSLGLLWLVLRRPQTEVLVHESDPPRPRLRPDHFLLRRALRRASLAFHTDAERRRFETEQRLRLRSFRLVDHTAGVPAPASRAEARDRLGIEPGVRLYLCAGFVHPAKGFERAVRAFGEAAQASGAEGRRLVVVGAVREPRPENLAYAERLRELCERTPGAAFVDRYVDDDELDLWIAAADRIVLPYRRSWSSGILARARALGTPALVSDAGGLPEQAGPGDVVFSGEGELARLFVHDGEAERG
ncbi:MAG: glycosyltransferase family 4 protein [Actinobacteria bacterium]|nr:glycosyltransferase family 4 protein [Actinomycetota bacterium]